MDSDEEKVTNIATSPDRHTFQKEKYLQRRAEEGQNPDNNDDVRAMVEFYNQAKKMDEEKLNNPSWRENNLEWDLRTTPWILEKVLDPAYAQNIYAALCNMRWQKIDVMPILKDEYWSCSWRYAGGIVADLRGEGDYIDWYCSGIRDVDYNKKENKGWDQRDYVPEGTVTEEICEDFRRLGWQPVDWDDDE